MFMFVTENDLSSWSTFSRLYFESYKKSEEKNKIIVEIINLKIEIKEQNVENNEKLNLLLDKVCDSHSGYGKLKKPNI